MPAVQKPRRKGKHTVIAFVWARWQKNGNELLHFLTAKLIFLAFIQFLFGIFSAKSVVPQFSRLESNKTSSLPFQFLMIAPFSLKMVLQTTKAFDQG